MKITDKIRTEVLSRIKKGETHRFIASAVGIGVGTVSLIRNEEVNLLTTRKPRILIYDIETAPMKAAVWRKWEANAVWLDKDWYMLSFSAKWLGEDKVHNFALNQYKGYKAGAENDKELVTDLWKMMDEADIVIAHNGIKFDNKKANARFICHGMRPPSPYQSIDTLREARKRFSFSSNKLNDLGEILKLGKKVETGGYKLWQGCLDGDKESWAKMIEYNEQDVNLLEKVYLELRPWMVGHPSLTNISGDATACPTCGGHDVVKNGTGYTKFAQFQQYLCNDCGRTLKARITDKKEHPIYKPN